MLVYESLELRLEHLIADLANRERQPEERRGTLRGGPRRGDRALRQPQHARVVAEVGVAQLVMAVEPRLATGDAVAARTLMHEHVIEFEREIIAAFSRE